MYCDHFIHPLVSVHFLSTFFLPSLSLSLCPLFHPFTITDHQVTLKPPYLIKLLFVQQFAQISCFTLVLCVLSLPCVHTEVTPSSDSKAPCHFISSCHPLNRKPTQNRTLLTVSTEAAHKKQHRETRLQTDKFHLLLLG